MKLCFFLLFPFLCWSDLLEAQDNKSLKKAISITRNKTQQLQLLRFRAIHTNAEPTDITIGNCRNTIYFPELIVLSPGTICPKTSATPMLMSNYYDLLKYNQPDEQAFQMAQNFALNQLRLNSRPK